MYAGLGPDERSDIRGGVRVTLDIAALIRIDELRAQQVRDALLALDAAMSGQPFEHLFADLIGREPELPEFLRPATEKN